MKLLVTALLIGICRVAAAGEATETLQVDGEVFVSNVAPWIGGSLHFEHRFADSSVGLVMRGSVTPGAFLDSEGDGSFLRMTALAGLRAHVDRFYAEAAIGWIGVHSPAYRDSENDISYDSKWESGVELDLQLGCRLGPVDVGAFFPILVDPNATLGGLGLRIGGAFDL